MDNNNYLVNGTDIHSKKSDQAPAEKGLGYPTLSNARCCGDVFGTPIDLLTSEPAPVSDYGLPHYSSLNKCYNLSEKEKKVINNKMTKNNLNPEETYIKVENKMTKNRNAKLGENVISYRIISKKDKNRK